MGVDVTTYVIYGIGIDGYDSEMADKLCDEEFFIGDGMSGEYMYIGTKLYASDNESAIEVDINSFPLLESNLRELFNKKYPEYVHYIEGKKFKIYSFLHYS